MFCQIGPAASNQQETSCSLTFANRVRATKLGQAKKNFAAEIKANPELRTPSKTKDQLKAMETSARLASDALAFEKSHTRELEQTIKELQKRLQEAENGSVTTKDCSTHTERQRKGGDKRSEGGGAESQARQSVAAYA